MRTNAIILDLHGVLFLHGEPIPGALESIIQLRARRVPLFFVSNSSTASRSGLVDQLAKYGITCQRGDVISAGEATVAYLTEQRAHEANIGLIGQEGLRRLLKESGFQHVTLDLHAGFLDYLIVARDPTFDYTKLAAAWGVLRNGATFLATSTDRIVPIADGYLPGPGPLVSALANASGIEPLIIGKPSPYMFNLLFGETDLQPGNVLVIGDNLETDIAAGQEWGAVTALVLTGMTSWQQAHQAPDHQRPDYTLASLARLFDIL